MVGQWNGHIGFCDHCSRSLSLSSLLVCGEPHAWTTAPS